MLLPRVFRVSRPRNRPLAGCHDWKRQGIRAALTRAAATVRSGMPAFPAWQTRVPLVGRRGRSPLVPRRPVLLIRRLEFLRLLLGQPHGECLDCLR